MKRQESAIVVDKSLINMVLMMQDKYANDKKYCYAKNCCNYAREICNLKYRII